MENQIIEASQSQAYKRTSQLQAQLKIKIVFFIIINI